MAVVAASLVARLYVAADTARALTIATMAGSALAALGGIGYLAARAGAKRGLSPGVPSRS